jgi:hypothetical protein
VDAVSGFEDVHVHRFTDDGKYLICFSRNQHDLVVYRFRGFGEAETPRRAEAAGPRTPRDARGGDRDADGDENKPPRRAPATTRDKYFDLLYTRPLTVDADLLARDFAVTILEGEYLLVASSTPAEAPPRDAAARERTNANEAGTADVVPARGPRAGAAAPGGGGGGRGGGAAYETTPSGSAEASASADASAAAARASGAAAVARARAEAEADTAARRGAGRPNATTTLPGSPTMDTVALHLVRLRDGRVCDRRVYRDDYVRLRRAAAVSVFAETKSSCLVSVLSLRWQAFRVLRVSLRSVTETETERAREVAAGSSEGDPSSLSDPANGGEDDPIAVFADARTPVGSACAPDDDAPLAAQDQAEREWRLARRRDYLGDGFFSGDDEHVRRLLDRRRLRGREPCGNALWNHNHFTPTPNPRRHQLRRGKRLYATKWCDGTPRLERPRVAYVRGDQAETHHARAPRGEEARRRGGGGGGARGGGAHVVRRGPGPGGRTFITEKTRRETRRRVRVRALRLGAAD